MNYFQKVINNLNFFIVSYIIYMEKYVYLLKDGNGKVVDVGQSHDPKTRLYRKTKDVSRRNEKTNFYGRTDITQEIVAGPMSLIEARVIEGRLKLHYGLEWTELNSRKITIDEANEIRAKYVPHKYTIKMLEAEYGVSGRTITRIIKNQSYVI